MTLTRELSDHDITTPSAELVEEYQRYLQNHWHSDARRFYVHIFVDVLGLYSKGRLTAPDDYKQHTQETFDKYKELENSRPKIFAEAANSELLAGIFGARLRGHKGMLQAMYTLFPNVNKEYEGIISKSQKSPVAMSLQKDEVLICYSLVGLGRKSKKNGGKIQKNATGAMKSYMRC